MKIINLLYNKTEIKLVNIKQILFEKNDTSDRNQKRKKIFSMNEKNNNKRLRF